MVQKIFKGMCLLLLPDYIYACSQFGDKILAIDPASNLLARTIDVNFSSVEIDQPHNVKKFGNYLYASIISAGKFLKIDIPTNTIVGTVEGLQQPGMIEISSDGKKAYVSKSATATGNNNEIYFINTESMTLEETFLPETGLPHGMAISSDDNFLYVANMTKDKISIVDLTTNDFVDNINLSSSGLLENEPMHLYISPDNNYLYACCRTSSKVLIISTSTRQIIQTIDIQDHPMQAAISEDGLTIYVVSHHEPIVTTITKSPTSETWTKTLEYGDPAFQHLYGADLSADGKYLYMTCSNEENDFDPHYSIPGVERQSCFVF
ncbi:MAG: YncE family protein [Ignavibacteriales bacterium]|nr:YncE family protein [Ignavibacteriales bacterium]